MTNGREAPRTAREAGATRRRRGTALGVALLAAASAVACGGEPGERPVDERPLASGAAADVRSPTGETTAVSTPAVTPGRDSVPVVLFAGTSLTAGLGLAPSDAYPAVLQRMADSAGLPVRVVNAGLSGETSAGLLRRLPWLLQQPADVIVIETGANDGLRGLNVDSTLANLRRIVAMVREAQPEARVLVVQMEAPPNLGAEYTSRFRAMFPTVARESGATLVPFLLEGVAGVRELNQADGIHPNEAGARRVAETVWPLFAAAVAGSVAADQESR